MGALPVSEADPAAVEEEINGLLDEIADLVEQGNRDEAGELAAQAYLENYDIEAAVIAAAPEVNEELEHCSAPLCVLRFSRTPTPARSRP